MLPAPYFHLTLTVPEELPPALRSNQRDGYGMLMKAAAEAIIELACNRPFVGGTVIRPATAFSSRPKPWPSSSAAR
jgi:hypothetical protein